MLLMRGSLLDLAACTRPNIAEAVGVLSKRMSAPTTVHWQAAGKGQGAGVRLLAATQNLGIQCGTSPGTITG